MFHVTWLSFSQKQGPPLQESLPKKCHSTCFVLFYFPCQPYDVNLQVTSVIAQLSQFKHPQLQEFLLNASLPLAPDCRSLHSTLQNVSWYKIVIHYSSGTLFCVKYCTDTFIVKPVKLGSHSNLLDHLHCSSRVWRQTKYPAIWKDRHDRNPPNYLADYLCFLWPLETDVFLAVASLHPSLLLLSGEKWRPEISLCPQAIFPRASNKYYLGST